MVSTAPTASPFTEIADPRLHNAHRVTEKVIAGAQPEGTAGFEALRDLGVRTIISVDGATPDVATARKYGLRYVHLPITYSTVTEQEGEAIAKAIHELPGPIYLHCHHGKHRSAAAVAVACVYDGSLQPGQAESVLKVFGTGENYTGLWKAAREAELHDPEAIKALKVDFVETAKIPPLAESMVLVDQHAEDLKLIQKSGWRVPAEHPDLDPPHEALQIREHFRETARTDAVKARPEAFRTMLSEGEEASAALEAVLARKPIQGAAADAAFKRLAASCAACHKAYRD
jgi:protein tyrosine phosphatase (PTP) superfamily phosphohydrolase (DUF442 family)